MNKFLKKITLIMCAAVMAVSAVFFAGCTDSEEPVNPTPTPSTDPDHGDNTDNTDNNDPTENETDYSIVFSDDTVTTNLTSGVNISGSTVTITAAGEYTFKGTATNGNIVVTVAKTEKVTLVLSGVDITSKTTAPIYVSSADKVNIVLADGTKNVLTDPFEYVYDTGVTKPNACIYSKDDIEIKGTGSLTVNANYNNGIGCKNDIKITGGTITISAVNNAIKGNDSVQISGGADITILSSDDGIKTDNEEETDKGYITIEDCAISITASDDGIVSNYLLTIKSTASISYNVKGDKAISQHGLYGE